MPVNFKGGFFMSLLKSVFCTEPLIGHGKIKITPCIKSCARDDLVITRKYVVIMR